MSMKEQIKTVEDRISGLEDSLDPEILGAVGDGVRKVIAAHKKTSQDEVCAMAFAAVKNALLPFPKSARACVLDKFNTRLMEADSIGYKRAKKTHQMHRMSEYNQDPKSPTILDLLDPDHE